jgi:hypothetical protein
MKTSKKLEGSVRQHEKHELDNLGNQLNPNNDSYWQSQGLPKRPDDWKEKYQELKKGKK